MQKEQKGITLVALVVTIIVLIILAGVSISLILGENGIIAKAREARALQANAQNHEREELVNADAYTNGIYEDNID